MDEHIDDLAAEPKDCWWCNGPGGEMRTDPYEEELYGEIIKRKYHDHCLTEHAQEI